MPTVDGLRLIEGQSNCSKGRACICSCFRSEKYDRYYLHFFWHSHACLVTVSVTVSAFGFSPKQLCGFADALAWSSLLCYSFCSFFCLFSLLYSLHFICSLYVSHLSCNLTSELKLRIKTSLKQQQQQHQLELLL